MEDEHAEKKLTTVAYRWASQQKPTPVRKERHARVTDLPGYDAEIFRLVDEQEWESTQTSLEDATDDLGEHQKLRQPAAQPQPFSERVNTNQAPPTETARFNTGAILRLVVWFLPQGERREWLEEQRGYLADLPKLRAKWAWIIAQIVAMPRYAHTVRSGRKKESA